MAGEGAEEPGGCEATTSGSLILSLRRQPDVVPRGRGAAGEGSSAAIHPEAVPIQSGAVSVHARMVSHRLQHFCRPLILSIDLEALENRPCFSQDRPDAWGKPLITMGWNSLDHKQTHRGRSKAPQKLKSLKNPN